MVAPEVPIDLAKSRLENYQDEISIVKVIDRITKGVQEKAIEKAKALN